MADQYGNPWPKYRNHAQKHLRPLVAVRHKCLDCCCEQAAEVKLCPVTGCPLHPYRFGTYPGDHQGPKTVLPAIKQKCRDCAPEPRGAVQGCSKKCCPLWHLRLGKNPARQAQLPPKGRGFQKITPVTELKST